METLTGVPAETIRRWLNAAGIKLRKRGDKPDGCKQ
jgi:hypothetical protein